MTNNNAGKRSKRMTGIILLIVAAAIVALCAYASTRPDSFRYERRTVIDAAPAAIFPYLSDLRKGAEWSPWEEKDSAMKRVYSEQTAGAGATYEWDGNNDIGAGKLEITEVVPESKVVMRLEFIRPFKAVNTAEYVLAPRTDGKTEVVWAMYGPNNFIGKLMSVFIDCEKMIGTEFDKGLAKLKSITEK